MKLTLISLAHRPDSWTQQGFDHYSKRFPPDWKLELIELKPETRTPGKSTEQILLTEANRIEQAIPKGAVRVAMDERGKDLTTHAMAKQLLNWHDNSSQLCLIIGSTDGLHDRIKQSCQQQWRLSSLTLPHALAKLLLIEALYRAWSVIAGHPYHRE